MAPRPLAPAPPWQHNICKFPTKTMPDTRHLGHRCQCHQRLPSMPGEQSCGQSDAVYSTNAAHVMDPLKRISWKLLKVSPDCWTHICAGLKRRPLALIRFYCLLHERLCVMPISSSAAFRFFRFSNCFRAPGSWISSCTVLCCVTSGHKPNKLRN